MLLRGDAVGRRTRRGARRGRGLQGGIGRGQGSVDLALGGHDLLTGGLQRVRRTGRVRRSRRRGARGGGRRGGGTRDALQCLVQRELRGGQRGLLRSQITLQRGRVESGERLSAG